VKVLVVGNGGREHALAWKLLQSDKIEGVVCVPGNGGTASMEGCENVKLAVDDFHGIKEVALNHEIAFVVIGPEVPLAIGLADYLKQQNIRVFGPTQTGAQLESSKSWAKGFMKDIGIPTAQWGVFTEDEKTAAFEFVDRYGAPIVVKADGLAAGKGVTVAATVAEAKAAIAAAFGGQFGMAGECVVVEEFLHGQEASVLAITDGETIRPLLPAQDHKAIGEGDTGPNTGGMGVYAPAPVVTDEMMARVETEVLQRAIAGLKERGIDYCGILYAGLMISPQGEVKVLEFNCRFGDPETQAILPLLETPLDELMLACIEKRLADFPPLRWKSGASACVVMASGGYPGSYENGKTIAGLDRATDAGAIVFHAGTEVKAGELVTAGGRVLGVSAIADNFDRAFAKAYHAVNCIDFEGAYYRRDIGHRVRTI
jgi:phosphoribosylamine--glycine ligase